MKLLITTSYCFSASRFGLSQSIPKLLCALKSLGADLRVTATTADVGGHLPTLVWQWTDVLGVPTWYEAAANYDKGPPGSFNRSPAFRR